MLHMNITYRCIATAALIAAPLTASLAQDLNPSNIGGGHLPIATPTYDGGSSDPALTTGSRFSVNANTAPTQNPTVPGATGLDVVPGDGSTISGDRRATIEQKSMG